MNLFAKATFAEPSTLFPASKRALAHFVVVAELPVTFDGWAQVAFPLAAFDCTKLTPVQPDGVAAKAVAVDALPVVLAALLGMSPETSARNDGAAAAPEVGPAHTKLAFCVAVPSVSM